MVMTLKWQLLLINFLYYHLHFNMPQPSQSFCIDIFYQPLLLAKYSINLIPPCITSFTDHLFPLIICPLCFSFLHILINSPAFLLLTSSIHSCTSLPFFCLPSQSSLMLISPNYLCPSLPLTVLPPVQKHSYVLQCSSLQPHGLEAPRWELEEKQEGPRVLNSRHPGLHRTRGVYADRLRTELWLVEPRGYYVRDAYRWVGLRSLLTDREVCVLKNSTSLWSLYNLCRR